MGSTATLQNTSRLPLFLDHVGYWGMHVACLGVIFTGVTWSDLALCLSLYVVRMFGLMAGYHRYFSHRAFKTSRMMQFLLGLLGTLGYQKGPLWWASHHRYHHRYSDTHLDVHSPVQKSFLYSHSGWFLDHDNRQTKLDRVGDLTRYPELVWLDNWNLIPVAVFAVSLLLCFGWSGFFWGFCVNTILVWHAIHAIGSFGHRFGGYRRFATTDNSRNKWFLALALLGEGWHNNHHYYPSSARQGFVWWEVDVAYYVLKALGKLGLIWDLRLPPGHVIRNGETAVQRQLIKFELWLQRLRLGLAGHFDEVAGRDAPLTADALSHLQLLRHSLENRLDDLGASVMDWLYRDPEQLRRTVAVFRADMSAEVYKFSGKLGGDLTAALAASLDDEFCRRARHSPIGHFLLSQNTAGMPAS